MPVSGKTVESLQLDYVTGSSTEVDFRTSSLGLIRRLVLTTDSDVYVSFDGPADDTNFVVQPGCPITMDNINFTRLAAQGVNSAGTLYILAMRD